MSFSPAAKAAMHKLSSSRKSHYDPSQPRDPHSGEWTSGGGISAKKAEGAESFRQLYDRMKAEGKSKEEIVAEARRQGFTNVDRRYIETSTGYKKKVVSGLPKPKPGVYVRRDLGDVARAELAKGGDAVARVKEQMLQYEANEGKLVLQRFHSMHDAERMYSVKLDNTSLYYASDDLTRTAAAKIIVSHARNELPIELTAHTRNIVMSTRNHLEGAYQKRFNIDKGLNTYATGGDKDVVFYKNGINREMHSSLAHEMGHNLARAVYGHTDPGPNSAIGKLYDDWKKGRTHSSTSFIDMPVPPPTNYAQTNRGEALAEAMSMRYVSGADSSSRYSAQLHPAYRSAIDETIALSRKLLLAKIGNA